MVHDHLLLGQGKITTLISEIFNVKYDYFGTVLSNLAKVWLYHPQQYVILSLVYIVLRHP